MDILTASVLSGIIYDGVKMGALIGADMLKPRLQNWLIDDSQIEAMLINLKEAGINEDLAPHAIERKITEHEPLLKLIHSIQAAGDSTSINQTSNIGNNISNSNGGSVTVGDISINKVKE